MKDFLKVRFAQYDLRVSIVAVLFLLIGSWIFTGCEKDDDGKSGLPSISTMVPSAIYHDSAVTGGVIADEGSSLVTDRGIVWSTKPGPTIELPTRISTPDEQNSFQVVLRGLTGAIKYYLRAYATNASGTAYGNELSFVTSINPDAVFGDLRQSLQSKMQEFGIPSLSIAVVRDGRLVYLDALGISDVEPGIAAATSDRYRIASLSKPLTLITILDLVQSGNISLDQNVFGSQGILGDEYGIPPAGSKKDQITIRHLLEHKSGWRNIPIDPMFGAFDLSQSEIIKDLLQNQSLATNPGKEYYYFNAGYCILGRIVERVTKNVYENWVNEKILKPAGIDDMRIGGSKLEERLPQEVKYYQPRNNPYGMNIQRMDAAGGWIANAKDLARFLVRVDMNPGVIDIIEPNLLDDFYFGFFNWYHYGSLSGTSAIMNRLNNQVGFILLMNTRTEPNYDQILQDLNVTVTNRLNVIAPSYWPERDLF